MPPLRRYFGLLRAGSSRRGYRAAGPATAPLRRLVRSPRRRRRSCGCDKHLAHCAVVEESGRDGERLIPVNITVEGLAARRCGRASAAHAAPPSLSDAIPAPNQRGFGRFFAFTPPGVLTRPEWPQRAFDRLAKPNLADLVAGAIEALGADRPERTLRIVSGLARNVGCRRPSACGASPKRRCGGKPARPCRRSHGPTPSPRPRAGSWRRCPPNHGSWIGNRGQSRPRFSSGVRPFPRITASEGQRSGRDKSGWDCGSAPGSPCK